MIEIGLTSPELCLFLSKGPHWTAFHGMQKCFENVPMGTIKSDLQRRMNDELCAINNQ